MTNMSNQSEVTTGLQVLRNAKDKEQNGICAVARGIECIWNTPIPFSYGSGDGEVKGLVNVSDMYKPRRNADGKVDGRFLPAVYIGFAEAIAIDALSDQDKQYLRRAHMIVGAKLLGESKVDYSGKYLALPIGEVFPLIDDKGETTPLANKLLKQEERQAARKRRKFDRAKALQEIQSETVICDGRKDEDYGKVPSTTDMASKLADKAQETGLYPVKQKRNRDRGEEGSGLADSLKTVRDMLKQVNETDEASDGFAEATETLMGDVYEQLAAYFSKFPPAGADD